MYQSPVTVRLTTWGVQCPPLFIPFPAKTLGVLDLPSIPRIVPAPAMASSATGFYAFNVAGFQSVLVCLTCYAQARVCSLDLGCSPKPRLIQFRSLLHAFFAWLF